MSVVSPDDARPPAMPGGVPLDWAAVIAAFVAALLAVAGLLPAIGW